MTSLLKALCNIYCWYIPFGRSFPILINISFIKNLIRLAVNIPTRTIFPRLSFILHNKALKSNIKTKLTALHVVAILKHSLLAFFFRRLITFIKWKFSFICCAFIYLDQLYYSWRIYIIFPELNGDLANNNEYLTWHCWGPCRFGEVGLGLDRLADTFISSDVLPGFLSSAVVVDTAIENDFLNDIQIFLDILYHLKQTAFMFFTYAQNHCFIRKEM